MEKRIPRGTVHSLQHRGFIALYLIGALLVAAGIGWSVYTWQGHRIAKLSAEVATLRVAHRQYQETLKFNQGELDKVIGEVESCALKRTTAEDAAHKAGILLETERRAAAKQSLRSIDEIKKDNSTAVCSAPVPARTVELLIAAAHSANGDTDGT